TDTERDLLYVSGKVLGLVASMWIAVRRHERVRRLADRFNFARDIYECVFQWLFGVSLVLGFEGVLDVETRVWCAREVGDAVADLCDALQGALTSRSRPLARSLREELGRLPQHRPPLPVTVRWQEGAEVPADA